MSWLWSRTRVASPTFPTRFRAISEERSTVRFTRRSNSPGPRCCLDADPKRRRARELDGCNCNTGLHATQVACCGGGLRTLAEASLEGLQLVPERLRGDDQAMAPRDALLPVTTHVEPVGDAAAATAPDG